MNIKSPVTDNYNTTFIEKISKKIIIDSYAEVLNVDVSRFFRNIHDVCLYKCNDTGYLFYYPDTISGDETFYDELKVQLPLTQNAPYYSDWKWEYDVALSLIEKHDEIYEIGCGKGSFLLGLKKNGIKNISGSELNKESVKEAQDKGLIVEYITIEDKAEQDGKLYDLVCCFQVLEHIAHIKSFLDSSLKILKKSGKLLIAVPYNDPFLFKNDKYNTLNLPPHHMGLWNKKSFEQLQKFYQFKLTNLIIENLPNHGYDFDQYFKINKDVNYSPGKPLKNLYDKLYHKWLKIFHSCYKGKNIVVCFEKL